MTNAMLNNLDTDDLVDFINNGCSKKDDLKKGNNAQTVANNNSSNAQAAMADQNIEDGHNF